jgi:hypothetical protein
MLAGVCRGAEPAAGLATRSVDAVAPGAVDQMVRMTATALGYTDDTQVRELQVCGMPGHTAILTRTRWELKSMPQAAAASAEMDSDAMKLPEAQRLKVMNRWDDHIQLWSIADVLPKGTIPQSCLTAADVPNRWHREWFFLGRAGDMAWYGYMTIYDFVSLEQKLGLQGDDIVAALIRGLVIEDLGHATMNSCDVLLAQAGPKALDAIDKAIAQRLPQRAQAVRAMAGSADPQVTRWLMTQWLAPDGEAGQAAKLALLAQPREPAKDLYVQWLAEGAGKRQVPYELQDCRRLKLAAAKDSVAKVLAAPASASDYRNAFEFSRELAGQPPMPPAIAAAERDVISLGAADDHAGNRQKIDQAVQVILGAGDPQAAAAAGLSLALFHIKGSTQEVRHAGVQVLATLPDGAGFRLVKLLAATNQESWQDREIKDLLAQLEGR